MKIHSTCFFKDQDADHQFLESWAKKLGQRNEREYKRLDVSTSLGNTVVWRLNADHNSLPFLFIFPGFRTSSLFWDLDNGLKQLEEHYRIYLVETNGQPVLSDGNTPEIKELDYGHWAAKSHIT